jgi:arabinogalactan endo-1,4-beta-galactosidase
MSKTGWTLVVCLAILFGFIYYWIVKYSPSIETPEDKILKEMELLSNKVDSIKRANDSIKVIIDTTEVEIEHVYEKYIQVRDRIIIQSVDSDCVFFSNYLSNDSKRFIDTINFVPAETY